MNPLRQLGRLASRPTRIVSQAMNRPLQRTDPLSPGDWLRGGGNLEEALRDRIVLVTGASSGIGEATAKRLGRAGGSVLLVARGVEKLEETAQAVEEAGGTAHVHPCDLTDMDAIDALAAGVLEQHGRVDVLVNNAGRSIRRSLALSYDRFHDFERTMSLNYFAPVRLMLRLLPGMRERRSGHVVNISTAGVQTRVPRFGAYIASKAALDTLCDAWQAEVQEEDVRFTTVYMPLVRTPMIEPTKIYRRFPALTPEQAAKVVTDAIVSRPRRVSPAFGRVASFADSVNPYFMDTIRNRGYKMFPESGAARGEEERAPSEEDVSAQGRAFAEVTRTYW